MIFALWFGLLALLFRDVAAADLGLYRDPDTGLTFSSSAQPYKTDGRNLVFRFAIPDAAQYSSYDAVIQIVCPNEIGWAGLAWGGGMSQNPLLVAWRASNNQNVIVSSRWANGHVPPSAFTGSTYTVLKTGTKVNSTHWQVTAKCTGCTSWSSSAGGARYVNPKGGNRLAWAESTAKPSNPNSNTSSINVHEVHGYWTEDFSRAINANFDSIVKSLQ